MKHKFENYEVFKIVSLIKFMKVAYEYGGGKEVVGCFYKDKLLKIIKTHTH